MRPPSRGRSRVRYHESDDLGTEANQTIDVRPLFLQRIIIVGTGLAGWKSEGTALFSPVSLGDGGGYATPHGIMCGSFARIRLASTLAIVSFLPSVWIRVLFYR